MFKITEINGAGTATGRTWTARSDNHANRLRQSLREQRPVGSSTDYRVDKIR